jgi:uncharacterized membrane protein
VDLFINILLIPFYVLEVIMLLGLGMWIMYFIIVGLMICKNINSSGNQPSKRHMRIRRFMR